MSKEAPCRVVIVRFIHSFIFLLFLGAIVLTLLFVLFFPSPSSSSEIFRTYWRDFCPSKDQLPKFIAKLASESIAADLNTFIHRVDVKMSFIEPDLKPVITV